MNPGTKVFIKEQEAKRCGIDPYKLCTVYSCLGSFRPGVSDIYYEVATYDGSVLAFKGIDLMPAPPGYTEGTWNDDDDDGPPMPTCECGAAAVGGIPHSDWCPLQLFEEVARKRRPTSEFD